MNKKEQAHKSVMSFLNDYFEHTPKTIIEQEIAEISAQVFAGTSASDYFTNFHKYYTGESHQTIAHNFVENTNKKNHIFKNIKIHIFQVSENPNQHIFHQVDNESNKQYNFGTSLELNEYTNIQRKKYDYIQKSIKIS
jgi:hypothetical protein